MKYIDTDHLLSNIKETENEFKTGNYYLDNSEQAVGYYNALMDFEKLISSLQQEQPNSKDLLEWAKKKFNEVEIAMETGADDPALWGERNAFKQVIDKLNSMKNEQLG